jgi:hypothetical protein
LKIVVKVLIILIVQLFTIWMNDLLIKILLVRF